MKKTVLLLLLVFLTLSSLFLTSCDDNSAPEETSSDTTQTYMDVKTGMSYSDIVKILGSKGEDIGYGFVIYEWKIESENKQLHVWFSQVDGNLIADSVRIEPLTEDTTAESPETTDPSDKD